MAEEKREIVQEDTIEDAMKLSINKAGEIHDSIESKELKIKELSDGR